MLSGMFLQLEYSFHCKIKFKFDSVLGHNFTIKTGFNFQIYSQNKSQSQNQFKS